MMDDVGWQWCDQSVGINTQCHRGTKTHNQEEEEEKSENASFYVNFMEMESSSWLPIAIVDKHTAILLPRPFLVLLSKVPLTILLICLSLSLCLVRPF